MVGKITLRLEKDNELLSDTSMQFHDINMARECHRAGLLEIRKCAGPPSAFEIMAGQHSKGRELEEKLDKSLKDMENSVDSCESKTINISNDITKNLTLVDEGIRVGLLWTVNKDKINNIKNRFESLKYQFIENCEYNIRLK